MALSTEVIERLSAGLLERTERGAVAWAPLSEGDGFLFQGTSSSVVIRSKDGDGRYPYVLELYDSENQLADDLETGWDSDEFGNEVPRAWNDALEHLYHLARRTAFQLDSLVDAVLEDIDQGRGVPGPEPSPPERGSVPARPGDEMDVDDIPF